MPIDETCNEKIELFVSCKDLPKTQSFSDTDPFVVIYLVDPKTKQLMRVGASDKIMNTRSPVFTKGFTIDYHFEVIQEVIIKVYHTNGSNPLSNESKHMFLGQGSFYLSSLMCSSGSSLSTPILGGKGLGTVEIKGEAKHNTRDLFCLSFSATKLSNKEGWFATSDPFLNVSRINEDNTWTAVWKSSVIDNSLNPKWAAVKIPMSSLCNGDLDRPLKIEILDFNKNGKHASMGVVETSVRGLLTSGGAGLDVVEPEKKLKKKGYTNSGTLSATNCMIEYHPTFTEFIAGGCQISLGVAIDFTASNGDPLNPSSLHYINPSGAYNAYQSAIHSVCNILRPYDTDNMYPVYGFGAKLRQANGSMSPVQHCFPVYGGGAEVQGVEGLLQAYSDCLNNVTLSGPTLFGPLIQAFSAMAAGKNCSQNKQEYSILLILTDGVINDMAATVASIVQASSQPLSIIIIGVGEADFTGMHELDSDKQLLKAGGSGKEAERDIVQFVACNSNAAMSTSELAAEVLNEVPTQLLSYMEKRRITPRPSGGEVRAVAPP